MEEAKWYVAHTFSGYENKVATDLKNKVENLNLTDMIQEIVIPTETVVEVKDDGTKKEIERKIFPSYIMVKMVMTDDTWYIVRNTRGCAGFVGPEGKPVALTEEDKALFETIRSLAETIENKDEIVAAVDEMQNAVGKKGFLQKYNEFVQAAANHMTVFAPFIPLLTKFLVN